MSKPTAGIEACKSLFGEHPEDVIGPIKSAADALGWLEELFNTIGNEALNERSGHRIKQLAAMGAYVASETSNFSDHIHETLIDRLRTAGIVTSEGVAA